MSTDSTEGASNSEKPPTQSKDTKNGQFKTIEIMNERVRAGHTGNFFELFLS